MAKAGDTKGAEQMMKSKDALVEAAGKVEQTDSSYKVDTTYIQARQKYIQDQGYAFQATIYYQAKTKETKKKRNWSKINLYAG